MSFFHFISLKTDGSSLFILIFACISLFFTELNSFSASKRIQTIEKEIRELLFIRNVGDEDDMEERVKDMNRAIMKILVPFFAHATFLYSIVSLIIYYKAEWNGALIGPGELSKNIAIPMTVSVILLAVFEVIIKATFIATYLNIMKYDNEKIIRNIHKAQLQKIA